MRGIARTNKHIKIELEKESQESQVDGPVACSVATIVAHNDEDRRGVILVLGLEHTSHVVHVVGGITLL